MISDTRKMKRKRKRTEQSILIWFYRSCMVLGCIVSSLVLPTRYSGWAGAIHVGYKKNRKEGREEWKIAAVAVGESKRKRTVIRGYHEVEGSRNIVAMGEIDGEKYLTRGSITYKLLHSDLRMTRKGVTIGNDQLVRKHHQYPKKKKHDKRQKEQRVPPAAKITTPEIKQGLEAMKHLSIDELEVEMHRIFQWNPNKAADIDGRKYYDEVNSKDVDTQEKPKYESSRSKKVKGGLLQADTSITLANDNRRRFRTEEDFILRPRRLSPESSEVSSTTHQRIVREVMDKEGGVERRIKRNKRQTRRMKRNDANISDHENDVIIPYKKDNVVVQQQQLTSYSSTVNGLSLPYGDEDRGVAIVETTSSRQSEDMLEHLCIENIPRDVDAALDVTFNELGVTSLAILDNLAKMGISQPTKIQVQALRLLIGGSEEFDVIIHSYTGSGKTLAFLLPIIQSIDISSDVIQALIIAPGRELGRQLSGVCDIIAKGSGARAQMLIGGANVKRQMDRIKKNKPHILIGTPGRLCEFVQSKRFSRFRSVKFLVLDEVDSLMNDPYNQELEKIVDSLSGSMHRQTIFSSATGCTSTVLSAASRLMKPNRVVCTAASSIAASGLEVNGSSIANLPLNIRHCFLCVPKVKKLEILRKLLHTQPYPEYIMVFVNDPYQGKWLTGALEREGIIAAPLFGDTSKFDRADIMQRLRSSSLGMVVTTEMAARGIDIINLSHVVNYDLPTDAEHYVHRSGRCGRAGRPGIVVNLVLPDEVFVMSKFEKNLGIPITEAEIRENKLLTLKKKFWESLQKAPA